MIGNYPYGNIYFFILPIFGIGNSLYLPDYRGKHIGIVIGLHTLHYHAQTFKAHSGIHMFGRQGFQLSVGLPIVLHKNQVPDLNDLGVIIIH